MTYKVHYFNAPGRAEVTRLCLAVGKVPYEDVFYAGETWAAFKPKAPFGKLPLLELPDGKYLAESGAMSRYAAKLGGLYPEDPLAAARADEAVFLLTDLMELFIKTYYMTDLQEKIKARQDLLAGKAKDYFGFLSKLIEGTNGHFIAGEKLSYADLEVFAALSNLISGQMDGIPTTLLNDYPVLKAFRNKVASVPAVKEFYDKYTEGTRLAFKPDH